MSDTDTVQQSELINRFYGFEHAFSDNDLSLPVSVFKRKRGDNRICQRVFAKLNHDTCKHDFDCGSMIDAQNVYE